MVVSPLVTCRHTAQSIHHIYAFNSAAARPQNNVFVSFLDLKLQGNTQ